MVTNICLLIQLALTGVNVAAWEYAGHHWWSVVGAVGCFAAFVWTLVSAIRFYNKGGAWI